MMLMRYFLLILLIGLSAATVTSTASAAQMRERYCLQGRTWGYPGNCQYWSYQQCMATASGTDAYCGIDPRYAYARQRRGWYHGR
jgi:Protein of unknown function (DUF3551)